MGGLDKTFTTTAQIVDVATDVVGPHVATIVTLQALRNMEMATMGRIYVDEYGNLRYEGRFARNQQ
jgi:hypothetical protein